MSDQISSEDQQVPAMTRRAALALGAVATLSVGFAAAGEPVAQLVAQDAEKNAAFMRGDMQRWSDLVRIADDFTLMQPFGGPPSRGFATSPARMAEMARYFRNGKTDLELVQTYACEDIVVPLMIERQTAEVGGLPPRLVAARDGGLQKGRLRLRMATGARPRRSVGRHVKLSRQPQSRVD